MNNKFSDNNIEWDYNIYEQWWVGQRFVVSNLSKGFHGLLKQWWDYYSLKFENPKVLLISENNIVKNELNNLYKNWNIFTLDLYTELGDSESDIIVDICGHNKKIHKGKKYDLIINQATLEHLYNPFEAMNNMCNSLQVGGYLISHTHSQNMSYHQ